VFGATPTPRVLPPSSETPPTATAAPTSTAPRIAPAADEAKAALERSPRHGEYADVAVPGGVKIRTWVSYPERKDKAPVVLVIHEVFGLTDWIRAVADRLAADGFIAVAPDLVSGLGPGGGGTDSVGSSDDVVALVRRLEPAQASARLDAVRTWALALPAAASKAGTLGFCWGGGRSFAYAADQPALGAAVVYYGASPGAEELARVNATVPAAEAEMKKLGKTYEVHTCDGAGHGFLRQQDGRDGAIRKAAEQAWSATIAFLRRHLE
jgi:carboxymethylenebutenolidase